MLIADRALENSRLKRELTDLRARSGATNRIVGKSSAMNQLRNQIERVAAANSRILIAGSPGTGKELCARVIHEASNRSAAPFVAINAANITPETMETELFGVEGEKAGPARLARLRKPMAARSISMKSATCRRKPKAKSCAC